MKIKICGLFRSCDIDYVNEAKPDWCGFVVHFPKSRRSVSPEQVRLLKSRLSPEITPVGVFVNRPIEEIAALLNDRTLRVAQLHGQEDAAYIEALRKAAPDCEIWQAFSVRSAEDLRRAAQSPADLVLLDNGCGTGQRFDWSLIQSFPRSFLLAGGLTPESLGEAARTLHPLGVDLSGGVETNRLKDRKKIYAAVKAARKEG